MLVLLGAKALFGIAAPAWAPEVLSGAAKGWPNAIPWGFTALLMGAGAYLAKSGRRPEELIICGLWVSGAAMFADRTIEACGYSSVGTGLALGCFYAFAAFVVRAEWRHRRPWAVLLIFGIAWPWLGIALPYDVMTAVGAVGTACLAVCVVESVSRYRPMETS